MKTTILVCAFLVWFYIYIYIDILSLYFKPCFFFFLPIAQINNPPRSFVLFCSTVCGLFGLCFQMGDNVAL